MTLQLDATRDELKLFLDEAEEHVQILDEGLLHLEREGADPHLLQEIFRAAHTLKGSSGAIGHWQMTRLTHVMEDVLDRLRNGRLEVGGDLIDALLQSLDLLRTLLQQVRTLDDTALDLAPTLARLEALDQPATPAAGAAPLERLDPMPLTPAEVERLAVAVRCGGQPWQIRLAIDTRTGLQAARALQVLLELTDVGQVIRSEPDQEAIEAERVGAELRVLVVTAWEEAPLRGLLGRIGDVVAVALVPYRPASPSPTPRPAAAAAGVAPGEPTATGGRAAVATSPRATKTVRMDVARLDRLMNLVGELVIDRTRLVQLGATLDARYGDDPHVDQLAEAALHVGRITDQLQEEIMKGRMLPIESVLNKLPRLARDLAAKMGKRVDLIVSGEETELDRSVLEAIGDPLIHLLRNAIDHGIEPPADRLAAGKPAEGQVQITARHGDNQIVITIRDDGHGIDPARIAAAAVRKGVIAAAAAERLTPAEALNLIFLPGFSTAAHVSDISGRGVGMDIVRTNIEKLNGAIQVSSVIGQGTTFVIRLPLTLAIIQALLVRVAGQTYAVPIASVVETLRIDRGAIQTVQQHEAILLRQQILPLLRLRRALGVADDGSAEDRPHLFVVAVRHGDEPVGLVVDRLVGEQEIVIKPLGRFIGDVPGISGATILGDGGVALILDIAGLTKHALLGRLGG